MKTHFFYPITLTFKVLWNKWTKFRDWLIELVAVKVLFPIAGVIQSKSPGHLQIDDLTKMPEGTFGQRLGLHMQQNKINFIRGFEEHDMKHLLLNYPLSVPGEMRLSAFEFGTGNRSFMTLGVFIPALIVAPELWPQLKLDYLSGKQNKQTRRVHLKSHLHLPLEDVREKLNVKFVY